MTDNKYTHVEIDEKTIAQIKANLIAKKEQLLKELSEITDETSRVKFPEYGDKLDENAQEIDEYTKNLATDKVLESTLRDIDSTLKRIKNGTYGICKYCKKAIPAKRLEARPVASTCIDCKTKLQSQ